MRLVNIYIATDSTNMRKSEKKYGYVLECFINEKPYTKEGFGEMEGTYNRIVLAAINAALERMNSPSEIHVFSENEFVLNMMKKSVVGWALNGFETSKKEPIKNQDKWIEYYQLSKMHLIVTEPGKHEYLNWLKEQMKKDGKKV